jgi:hypothetical protein
MSGEVRLVVEGCYAFGRWGELRKRQAMRGRSVRRLGARLGARLREY